jgi:adenosylcobinamide-GDP ribazoletransferase
MGHVTGALVNFGLAWRLLTAIPLPFIPEAEVAQPGRAAAYFPLVGLGLGLFLAALDLLLGFIFQPLLAAAVLLLVWVGFTGLLHLDGFMDACDGLLPPRDPARRLEIMRDSRVGAFGVVSVVLLLLLKFSGLVSLPAESRLPTLITVPVLARWAMTWAMIRYPAARPSGLAEFFRTGLGRQQLVIASVVALAVAVGLMGVAGLGLCLMAWLTAWLVASFAVVRLGGLTGDIYGTICEVTETALLLTVIVGASLGFAILSASQ